VTERDVQEQLSEAEVVACAQGSIPDMKRLRERCLEEGIPAMIGAPPGGCSTGCGTKAHLMVREADLPAIARLMQGSWQAALEREGTGAAPIKGLGSELAEHEELPCPACGTAAPLVDGACSDCGLMLE
jgi:hypothetical protein